MAQSHIFVSYRCPPGVQDTRWVGGLVDALKPFFKVTKGTEKTDRRCVDSCDLFLAILHPALSADAGIEFWSAHRAGVKILPVIHRHLVMAHRNIADIFPGHIAELIFVPDGNRLPHICEPVIFSHYTELVVAAQRCVPISSDVGTAPLFAGVLG